MSKKIVDKKTYTFMGWLSFKKWMNGYNYHSVPVLDHPTGIKTSLLHRFEELSVFYQLFSVRYGYSSEPKSIEKIAMDFVMRSYNEGEFNAERIDGYYSEMTPYTDYVVNMKIGGHDIYKEIYNYYYSNLRSGVDIEKTVWMAIEINVGNYASPKQSKR